MASKRKKPKVVVVPEPKRSYKETIQNKVFKKVFEATGEILEAEVLDCAWNNSLIGQTVLVMQTDYDFFLAVDYQTDNEAFKYGFLAQNIKIINIKYGWIESFDNEKIKCMLRKDNELDEVLTLKRNLLTKKQNEMIVVGQLIRYDKQSGSIEFLLENGAWDE